MKNLEEELRHFRAHAGAIQTLDALAQSGDTLKYMRQMKAIKDRMKAGTLASCSHHFFTLMQKYHHYLGLLTSSHCKHVFCRKA